MRKLFRVGSDRHDTGKLVFSWHPEGQFLASAGRNGIVQITDRHGDISAEIPMTSQSPILAIEWDKDGESLAIMQENNGLIQLWSSRDRKVVPIDTTFKDPSFLAWSKETSHLAIGTAKGNLVIYNKAKKQKIPIVGLHGKKIISGCWSKNGNKLILGSEDKSITVNNEVGDRLLHCETKNIPIQLQFAIPRGNSNDYSTISTNLAGKAINLFDIRKDNSEGPTEISFPAQKYGEILLHIWIDDGLLLCGFKEGYLVVVNTGGRNFGEEQFSYKFHQNLIAVSYNPILKHIASAGDDGIKIISAVDFKEIKENFISIDELEPHQGGRITGLLWSPDGQILTVCTSVGNAYNFLAKMNVLNAKYKSQIAYLSSLREVTIFDASNTSRRNKDQDNAVTLKLEPAMIALGPRFVAAGMNNKMCFHRIDTENYRGPPVIEQEYVSTVKDVQINNSYAAVLLDSKAMLHLIEQNESKESREPKYFPNREEGTLSKITCIALVDDFLYYGTEAGTLEVFCLSEWVLLAGTELRLDKAIKQIYSNSSGTRVVVVDAANDVYLFNPVTGGGINSSIIKFDDAPTTIKSILWDYKDKNIVTIFDGKFLHTYVYVPVSMKRAQLIKVGPVDVSKEGEIKIEPEKVEFIHGNMPIMIIGGVITSQNIGGNISTTIHKYYDHIIDPSEAGISNSKRPAHDKFDKKFLANQFCQCLASLKLELAWKAAFELNKRKYWLALSGKAMELLQIPLACRVFRQLEDAGMVMALQELSYIEDTTLLAGHVSLLFGDYQRAQELFLTSSQPSAALTMRRDLLNWDEALKIAQGLNSPEIPDIYYNYGIQLELKGNSELANRMFEDALNCQDNKRNNICPENLIPLVTAGMARCNIRLGNIRQGIKLANELDDRQLYIDCGDLLQKEKQYSEAATLFLKAQHYEKAALVYVTYIIKSEKDKIKAINDAVSCMEKVNNDEINDAFGKLCVVAKQYDEACKAFKRAKNLDKVIEIKLKYLDQAQDAFDIVRTRASAQGALFIVQYCQEHSDFRGMIEFLLIANNAPEAFKIAQAQGLVETYTNFLGDQISAESAEEVAKFYEKHQDPSKAGKFYAICGHYQRAVKLFLQCGDLEIDSAIKVVEKSQNDSLFRQVRDFIVGEQDGQAKDTNHLYRLLMALKRYDDAAKTANKIALESEKEGNYVNALATVVDIIQHLENSKLKVSTDLRQTFVLLHSYQLAKMFVRKADHDSAARLLLRIAQNTSRFPLHVTQIIVLTVVECQRAGMKVSAYEYALLAIKDHRQNIDVDMRRKIEGIVRKKSSQTDEAPEATSLCPISSQEIPVTMLECPTTKDALPMCIVTGRHMVLDDWCFCPNSKFPAIYSEYVKYINNELRTSESATALDPIHSKPITASSLVLVSREDAMKYIQIYNNVIEKKAGEPAVGGGSAEGGENGAEADKSPTTKSPKKNRDGRRHHHRKHKQ